MIGQYRDGIVVRSGLREGDSIVAAGVRDCCRPGWCGPSEVARPAPVPAAAATQRPAADRIQSSFRWSP